MNFSLRGILLGLAISGLHYGAFSRALPRAGIHECDGDACTAIKYLPLANVTASTIFASPLYNLDRRALRFARLDIEPPIDPDPVITTDPKTGDPGSDPVSDGDPTNPQSPGQTDGSGPIDPETYVPPKSTGDGQPPSPTNTPPTITPTDLAPTPTATDKAPTVTPTGSTPEPTPTENAPTQTPTDKDSSPTATNNSPTHSVTDGQPSKTNLGDATPPDATSGPDATTDDQPLTSDSPGGASGDISDDAGGFGDSPNDDECLISSRDIPTIQRRCSRHKRPIGWTAYDDMAATDPPIPDTALEALNAAIKDNSVDEFGPDYHESYVDDDISDDGTVKQNSFDGFFLGSIPDLLRTDPFFKSKSNDQYQRMSLKSAVPEGTRNRNKILNESGFSVDRKTIVASYSNADFDTTHSLTWSEMVFERYHELAGDDVNQLESVLMKSVGNPDTLNTMKKAFTNIGKTFGSDTSGEKVVFNANAPVGSAEKDAFAALLRTDSVRGVNWMLGDHHQAIGDKRITSITIWPSGIQTFMLISIG